uniref:Uncharacterized protein n=1 Tax=Psilocybe cubensis TaxID=181762 RepID=A0A8H7XLM6_PSICU
MVTYNEWDTSLTERVTKLNASIASRIFEVGGSHTLIIFEIGSVFGDNEMRELMEIAGSGGGDRDAVLYNAKPGLWSVVEGTAGTDEAPFCATWVSDGHIDYDSLPQEPLVFPLNLDGIEWRKVHEEYFNSTIGCVLALEVVQEFEEVGIGNALSAFADLGGVVPGGFIWEARIFAPTYTHTLTHNIPVYNSICSDPSALYRARIANELNDWYSDVRDKDAAMRQLLLLRAFWITWNPFAAARWQQIRRESSGSSVGMHGVEAAAAICWSLGKEAEANSDKKLRREKLTYLNSSNFHSSP